MFSDENFETMNIQVELPGVDKNNINCIFMKMDSMVAKVENTKYMGSYSDLSCTASEGHHGIFKWPSLINVPYKKPFEPEQR